MKKIGLYIHIPFCRSKCNYCKFASFGNVNDSIIEKYIDYLCKEIEYVKANYIISTLYFGGGTPSILSNDYFLKIFKTLKKNFIFDDNIEITLETNPSDITRENLLLWESLGVNRLSIGVQTINKDSLKEIGRFDKGDIFDSLNLVKEMGDTLKISYGLDFIIGLPYVKKGEIEKDIKGILESYNFINHISIYMLEGSISDYKNSWELLSIKENEYLEEYKSIYSFLKNNGFNRYEISNYSKTGFECRHNIGYWKHKEYIGVGLGAHSFIDNQRFKNSENINKYFLGEKEELEILDENDIFLEKILFLLRTEGISIEYMNKLNDKKIKEYIKNGYLKIENNKLIIQNNGVLFIDYILQDILI